MEKINLSRVRLQVVNSRNALSVIIERLLRLQHSLLCTPGRTLRCLQFQLISRDRIIIQTGQPHVHPLEAILLMLPLLPSLILLTLWLI